MKQGMGLFSSSKFVGVEVAKQIHKGKGQLRTPIKAKLIRTFEANTVK
jgi:hypothetical protein